MSQQKPVPDNNWFNDFWDRIAMNTEMGAVTDLLCRERPTMNIQDLLVHDALEGAIVQLEAFADEFERLAKTREQLALAADFQRTVASFAKAVFPSIEDLLLAKQQSPARSRSAPSVELGR